MKRLALIPLVMFALLPITSLHGQEGTQERSYQSCYTSFETAFMLNNTPADPNSNDPDFQTDLNDPDIKQYYSNICNFIHDKYGIWITFADFVDDPDTLDWSDFKSKYYLNGMPDSVKELNKFKGME